MKASRHLTARDTAAEDAAILGQRRRIEEKEDADRAAVAEARRQLQADVRASQLTLIQQHGQQRWGLQMLGPSAEQVLLMAADGSQTTMPSAATLSMQNKAEPS